ncbi:hypothetical protein FHG87_017536 [Trinorchestia longiramus]|nr:hypothetical protein FHG87_017536 [Trinorchestia longiramus]
MKLQLLVIACLIALSSALAAKRPSQMASGLSHSARINNFGLTARDDDFDVCFGGYCMECENDETCQSDNDCDDDDSCINGYCCEFEQTPCTSDGDCDDDD